MLSADLNQIAERTDKLRRVFDRLGFPKSARELADLTAQLRAAALRAQEAEAHAATVTTIPHLGAIS